MKIKILSPTPYPDLASLLAVYLADGIADYPTLWDAVRAFLRETPREFVDLARSELHEVLRTAPDEESLRAAADMMACGYYPPGDGMTYREFFAALEQALSGQLH